MGSVILPVQGLVALDSAPLIYIVERHPVYWPLLTLLWTAAEQGDVVLVVSELALAEAMSCRFGHPTRRCFRRTNSSCRSRASVLSR